MLFNIEKYLLVKTGQSTIKSNTRLHKNASLDIKRKKPPKLEPQVFVDTLNAKHYVALLKCRACGKCYLYHTLVIALTDIFGKTSNALYHNAVDFNVGETPKLNTYS
ncbi:hypothetical protein NQ317_014461, partial [Molorchus minor]